MANKHFNKYWVNYWHSNTFQTSELLEPSECGSTVAMRTSVSEINQSQSSAGSSDQCFSNPSYHTVAQCNVSTISSKLDGTQTHKVWPLSSCSCVEFNFLITLLQTTPNCALPFTVEQPEKQKWLGMESLLHPQWYRSVFLSVTMMYHTHAELCAESFLQGQRRICH